MRSTFETPPAPGTRIAVFAPSGGLDRIDTVARVTRTRFWLTGGTCWNLRGYRVPRGGPWSSETCVELATEQHARMLAVRDERLKLLSILRAWDPNQAPIEMLRSVVECLQRRWPQ